MASTLRRPFAVATSLVTKPTASSSSALKNAFGIRAFHRPAATSSFTSQSLLSRRTLYSNSKQSILPSRPSPALQQNVFQAALRSGGRRTYMQEAPQQSYQQSSTGNMRQRLIYGGAIFGGTLVAINLIFNRETREDGGMPPFERAYLNETFLHTGLGIGIIGVAARALHSCGWSIRLMSANPWLVMGVGLVGSIGTMMGAMAVPPDNYVPKYALWGAFNLTQAALLSPLMFMHPALLARAGLYTVGMMGSIAFVGATAKQEKYLYLGGPLLAGVAIVALSGLAPLVVPATAVRTLMVTENLWLYGGLAVFGGFTLYDVQKVLAHARMAERGLIQRDPVKESISLELDFINIFIRMVQILGMQQNRRK